MEEKNMYKMKGVAAVPPEGQKENDIAATQ